MTYCERALEEYKQKLIQIYPDAFNQNQNKNDYRAKMNAIKELEERQQAS